MRAVAATPAGQFRADELRAKADELEQKTEGYYSEPQTVEAKSFLGAWARARRCYCEVIGEPLV